jgi:hypothetical protein
VPDTKLEAARLRVALDLGLVTVADVVAWSDSLIESSEHPDPAFLELSSMWKADPLDVWRALEAISEDLHTLQVLPWVLGLAHARLLAQPTYGKELAARLNSLSADLPEDFEDITWLAQAFQDAEDGYIAESVEDVREMLLKFIERFTARRTHR